MSDEEVIAHFKETGALLEGHFLLSSGLHSTVYLQCALVLMHPQRASALCSELARKVRAILGSDAIDCVVSPAMGGVVVGYEMGRQLGLPAMFTERIDGKFAFRRGFELAAGTRTLMVEDVVTTGLSSRECIDCIRNNGGDVVGAACLVDRSDGKADVGVPLVPLLQMSAPVFAADEIPAELAGVPAVKPGSRGLQ
jgi:orotate phosphoribosyltransferase